MIRTFASRSVLLAGLTVGLGALVAASTGTGCATANDGFGDGGEGSSSGGSSSGMSLTPDTGTIGTVTPDAGPPPTTVLLYAHTDTTLFSLDPKDPAKAPTKIGDFDCIDPMVSGERSMTDFAVAKDGSFFGVSPGFAYPLEVKGSTVHCKEKWPLPAMTNFYGMTLAPEGVLGTGEVLVAANSDGELYTIDAKTGMTKQVGTLGQDGKGNDYQLSGDIVFLENKGTPVGFATVKACSTKTKCDAFDTLIELDVRKIKPGAASALRASRGKLYRGKSCGGNGETFQKVFGLAAYNDKVYGFTRGDKQTDSGQILEINNRNGETCILGTDSGNKFAGAGVTTVAPVIIGPN
jgi:hypothetical protein